MGAGGFLEPPKENPEEEAGAVGGDEPKLNPEDDTGVGADPKLNPEEGFAALGCAENGFLGAALLIGGYAELAFAGAGAGAVVVAALNEKPPEGFTAAEGAAENGFLGTAFDIGGYAELAFVFGGAIVTSFFNPLNVTFSLTFSTFHSISLRRVSILIPVGFGRSFFSPFFL